MQRKLNEDFIDSYCEKFASKVSAEFFVGSKRVITGKEILSVTPSKQVNFFVIKLLFRYWQEETKKLESPFFNYKDEEVRKAMIQFMNVLSQHIEIHRGKFETLLNHAVKDTIYLAALPQAYVEIDLDSRGIEVIGKKAIEGTTKYLKIYKKEIHDFLTDLKGATIDDLIDELPHEFEDFDTSETVIALCKNLSSILEITLEKVYSEDPDIDDFDEGELLLPGEEDLVNISKEKVLGSVRKSRKEIYKEDKEVVINHEDKSMEHEEITEDAFKGGEQEIVAKKEERKEDIAEEEEKLIKPQAIVDEEEKEDSLPQEIHDKQLEKKEEMKVEHYEFERKSDSILAHITPDHRDMFIKGLFKNDKDEFENALSKLEDFESFDESVEYTVQNYAKHHRWDMQSDEVKEFLKVLFRRFR
ncbi:MAG: hypothetical protein AAGC64_03145 [Bacteroidota bacterium]